MAEQEIVDDLDDLYGPASTEAAQIKAEPPAEIQEQVQSSHITPTPGLPGLGSKQASMAESLDATLAPADEITSEPATSVTVSKQASVQPESTNVETERQAADVDDFDYYAETAVENHAPEQITSEEGIQIKAETEPTQPEDTTLLEPKLEVDKPIKAQDDPDFMEAANAQKSNEKAEWQFDSSDEESSSESDSDTSSDEDSDEEDYEMLDPATAARMLMAEEGGDGDDDEGHKPSTNAQLRTKNEQPPEIVPKPDVTVTPEMKITVLGNVEHIVDNYMLITAQTSGEYQVLEQGSVLCLEDRTVIGAVAETIGRVQQPMYSVAFTTKQEIDDMGMVKGTKIFYVDAHSTFVFTQPLRNLKGTDASNLHDEEVGADEMEFSDDEAEAAYKRAKKEAKRGNKAGGKAPMRNDDNSYAAADTYQAMNYDDVEGDEMYTPLARPSNLQDMMTVGRPPIGQRPTRGGPDRGRGRGGRGRGDRGRGDRGRGGRGGRGGMDDRQRKGPANSYPDQHNHSPQAAQVSMPPPIPFQFSGAPGTPSGWPLPPPPPLPSAPNSAQAQPQANQQMIDFAAALQQYQQQQQQQYGQTYQWPQYQQQQTYMNPAFFGQQQQAQQQHAQYSPPPPPPTYGQNGQSSQNAGPQMDPNYQAALQQLEMIRRMNGGQS
ncbi:hypothetical protein MBLNU457_2277t2 [Dothideomycetes sp. NU457]